MSPPTAVQGSPPTAVQVSPPSAIQRHAGLCCGHTSQRVEEEALLGPPPEVLQMIKHAPLHGERDDQ